MDHLTARRDPIDLLVVGGDADSAARMRDLLSREATLKISLSSVPEVEAAKLRMTGTRPDLVIVDLPDQTALAHLPAIHHTIPDVPLIVLTDAEGEEIATEAMDGGADDTIPRSRLDTAELTRSIRYAMLRNRGRRELAALTRELQAANTRLERLTRTDPLTDLLNRRGLQEAIGETLKAIDASGDQAILFLLDLDDFKTINDTLGHAVGDIVLQEVATRLRTSVRSSDHVARVGGDEFLLLLPHADPREMYRIGERLRAAISGTTIRTTSASVPIHASMAVLQFSDEIPAVDLILSRAHPLLRRSKQAGKNRISGDSAPDDLPARADELSEAICRGEGIYAVCHPIVRLMDGTVAGYEILSRFTHPRVELPGSFFALCAERNLLALADHQCFRRCLDFAATLPRTARKHVNLFPSTLLSVSPAHLVRDIRQRFDPSTICVELSESQILGDPAHLVEPIEELREAGVAIGLDDVGFGNTSIESLLLLEPDVIKLDRRVVRGVGRDRDARKRLERLVEISRQIATQVIAEGLQNQEDLESAKAMGIRFGQGYLWGRPA